MTAAESPTRHTAFGLVHQLALYTAFHQSVGNRLAHAVFVPLIFFTMMCLTAYLRVPAELLPCPLAHAATLLTLVLCGALARLDKRGATILLLWFGAGSAFAGHLVETAPAALLVPIAVLVHAVAWAATVVWGHQHVEPELEINGHPEDSNAYFRHRYYLSRNLGIQTTRPDAFAQFCIAPLAVVHDGLLWLGLRKELEAAVALERGQILAHLQQGLRPLHSILVAQAPALAGPESAVRR